MKNSKWALPLAFLASVSLAGSLQAQDFEPAISAERQLVSASQADKTAAEARALSTLADPHATQDAKFWACHRLYYVAGESSVAPLASLLADEQLGSVAIHALVAIPSAQAGAALCDAAAKLTGPRQNAVMEALALRHEAQAVDVLSGLLKTPTAAPAALRVLGRIGTREAAAALAQASVEPALIPVRDTARLSAAQQLDTATAQGIYAQLWEESKDPIIRLGALRGLVRSKAPGAEEKLASAIKTPDLRRGAVTLLANAPTATLLSDLLASLANAPADQVPQILWVLGECQMKEALPALLSASQSPDPAIKIAALEALGQSGDIKAVDALLTAAGDGGATGRTAIGGAAMGSLARLEPTEPVNARLKEILLSDQDTQKAACIRGLTARNAAGLIPLLYQITAQGKPPIQREAAKALGQVGQEGDLEKILELLVKNPTRGDLESSFAEILRRLDNPKNVEKLILDKLASTSEPASYTAMLHIAALVGTPGALTKVVTDTQSSDEAIRTAAVRTLIIWSNPNALPELLKLAGSAPSENLKILALRGYVQWVGKTFNPVKESGPLVSALEKAMPLAQRKEEKILIIGELGKVSSRQSLKILAEQMKNPELQTEATAAYQAAGKLGKK